MLTASTDEPQPLVKPLGRGVGVKGVKTEGLLPLLLGDADRLPDHLLTNAFTLPVRTDGQDMDHRHFVIRQIPEPLDRMIIRALVRGESHHGDDRPVIPAQVHSAFLDIGADALSGGVLPLLPPGMTPDLRRAVYHVIVEGKDGPVVRKGGLLHSHNHQICSGTNLSIFLYYLKLKLVETVDVVVFCSKDYSPILDRLHEISDRFNCYYHYTITAYGTDIEPFDIHRSGCMTAEIFSNVLGIHFKKTPHQGNRAGCLCIESRGLGDYNSCPNGCRYCYANKDPAKAMQNYLTHDPKSPLLLGHLLPTDTVKPLKQESFLSKELSLFG